MTASGYKICSTVIINVLQFDIGNDCILCECVKHHQRKHFKIIFIWCVSKGDGRVSCWKIWKLTFVHKKKMSPTFFVVITKREVTQGVIKYIEEL